MTADRVPNATAAHPDYRNLYRIGGAAAFIVVALMLAVVIIFTIYPQPETVLEWFELFQDSKIIGLLDFWALEVLMYPMLALVFLALYFTLREANPGLVTVALVFSLLGVAIFLATNRPIAMLSLSDQYAAAATEADRSIFLAAGQVVLTNTGQRVIGGFNLGLFLVSVAGLIVSSVMLRSSTFSRAAAYMGIVAYALSLLDYLRQVLTQSTIITLLVILASTLLLVAWFVLIGRRLFQLGRPED